MIIGVQREQSVIDAIAEKNVQLLKNADCPARLDFIERYENDTAFYFHQQYTENEKTKLREKKQLDIPIDRVRPIIRRNVAKIVRKRPTIVAYAEDDRAVEMSRRINAQAQYATRISKGLTQLRKSLLNTVRGGLSFIYVYVDNKSGSGENEVKYKYKSCKRCFIDPSSEDPLFDDARWVQILDKVNITDAVKMFPDKIEEILYSANTSYQDDPIVDDGNFQGNIVVGHTIEQMSDDFDGRPSYSGWVEIITTYKKEYSPTYEIKTPDDTGNIVSIKVNEDEAKQARKRGADVNIVYKTVILEEITTPFRELRTQTLDFTDEYPLTPFIWEDTENPYPIGETYFIRGHQKLQNAVFQVLLSNAQVSSFPTVWYETGAFKNRDEALIQITTPGGAVEFNPSVLKDGRAKWDYGKPLNQQFVYLSEQIKTEQEYQASSPALQQGDASNIPETNKALVNLDSFADRTLALNADAIESAVERIFINVIKFQDEVYTDEKLLLIDTDPDNNEKINDNLLDVDENGKIVRKNITDLENLRYDVALLPGSMNPLDKSQEYQMAYQVALNGWTTPEFALKKMPIKGIEEEIKRVDSLKRVQELNTKQQEVIQDLQQQLDEINNRLYSSELDAINSDYRAKFEVTLKRLEDKVNALNKEARKAERINTVNKKNISKSAQTQKENAG